MKDLDFDELDRAVNSIMSGSKGPSVAKEDATPTGTAPLPAEPSGVSATPTRSEPSIDTSMPVPMSVSSQSSEPEHVADAPKPQRVNETERKAPVATRRGRFMDMVRPGAVQPSDATPARVSRQGSTIEPAGPLVSDIIPSTTTPPVAKKTPPVVTPSLPTATPTPPASAPVATEWPDPLDMLQDEESPRSGSDAEPLVSPFLSGTKVEKRPLGIASSQSPKEDALSTEVTEPPKQQDSNPQLVPSPADSVSAPLPEELSNDLMALESDANTMAMPADEVKTEVARQVAEQKETSSVQAEPTDITPVVDTPKKADTVEAVSVKPSTTPEPEPITPKGPISIPQQYREEPSTGDKGNGAIYDTDTYHHQPLAHPKKKKSGWLWVVWIILILIVGAACGAALYWFGVF